MTWALPLIGITANVDERSFNVRRGYADAVLAAGGLPVLLTPPDPAIADPITIARDVVARLEGFVFTGGADPRTEAYGEPTHPLATTVHPHRQAFEEALLRALDARRDTPVLGVCLGMQMMTLHAGGALHQHLPEILETAPDHTEDRTHRIKIIAPDPVLTAGEVNSNHHQGVRDVGGAGTLRVIGVAHDGVIEAVRDPARPFYLGVQWHPERMGEGLLGWGLFRALVDRARGKVG